MFNMFCNNGRFAIASFPVTCPNPHPTGVSRPMLFDEQKNFQG
jgi:hypothetical protein